MTAWAGRAQRAGREASRARGWALCTGASMVYALAVMHRTSVGARTGDLVERYGLSEWSLSLVPTATVLAYAALQIPIGLLVDRVGPRFTLVLAAALLGTGSVWLALADTLGGLLGARVVLGLGDASVFLSILRLAHRVLPDRYYGMVAALANALGALGQLVGIFPLQHLLDSYGWVVVFLALGAAAAALGAVMRLALPAHQPGRSTSGGIRVAITTRDVQIGAVLHALLMPQFLVLTALWGVPMFTDVLGVPERQATTMVMWSVVAFLAGSVVFSTVHLGSRPGPVVAVGLGLLSLAAWLLLATRGQALEAWYGYLLSTLSGIAASGVGLAFAHAHRGAPAASVALRSSIVNGTSFSATGGLMLLSGLMLAQDGGGSFTIIAWILAAWTLTCLVILGLSRLRPRDGPMVASPPHETRGAACSGST